MSKKRQLLIDTALDLFYKNGINAIGINEILAVSGVAKRTLYTHFVSKDALVVAALELRHQTFMTWLENTLLSAKSDQEVVAQLFHGLERWFNHQEPMLGTFRGCFFINTCAEFSDSTSDVFRLCHRHKQEVKARIAQQLHEPNAILLDAICIMKEGAIVTAQLTGNHDNIAQRCVQALAPLYTD